MNYKIIKLIFIIFFIPNAYSKDFTNYFKISKELKLIKVYSNGLIITESKNYLFLNSNGIPNHKTGHFPSRSNPHSISPQSHKLRITKKPKKQINSTPSRFFGIALNGVMFAPSTAECWDNKNQVQDFQRRKNKTNNVKKSTPQRLRNNKDCSWREEAIVNEDKRLGLDNNFAHVQPSGMYHYHGTPTGLIESLNIGKTHNDLIHVGYAGDGFKIFISKGNKYKSSYKLKSGNRINGPFGRFDGTYTQDFKFISTHGDLDKCNGLQTKNEYFYIITNNFPFIPRCWYGKPDPSFLSRPDR